jgi:hypothetical protein
MSMSARVQLGCLWCLPVALVMIFGGVALAGFLPPPSPSTSASEIQRLFLENATRIRVGIILAMIGATLSGPFVAAISVQMRRVEGSESPLAYTQLLAGLIANMLGVIPFMFLVIAAFRADRSPELVLLLNDASWLMNIGIVYPTALEILAVAVCAFIDKQEIVFPRWYAWLSLWVPFVFTADLLVFFFKSGPFAFNGAICFWTALGVLCLWLLTTLFVLRKAILSREREQAPHGLVRPALAGASTG